MAWPCITRACCIARFWNQLDKADIAVPLVFTKYSEATQQQRPAAGLPTAVQTQPAALGGDRDVVTRATSQAPWPHKQRPAAGLPTAFETQPAALGGDRDVVARATSQAPGPYKQRPAAGLPTAFETLPAALGGDRDVVARATSQAPGPYKQRPAAGLPTASETQPAALGGDQDVVAQAPEPHKPGPRDQPSSDSVMRQDYKPWKVQGKETSCKPKCDYQPSDTPFARESQYQKDFQAWPIPKRGDHPWIPKPLPIPPVDLDKGSKERSGSQERRRKAQVSQEKEQGGGKAEEAAAKAGKAEEGQAKKTKKRVHIAEDGTQTEPTEPGASAPAEGSKGRAAVDALNRQIKEEVTARVSTSSYRNEFRPWTDIKPVKAIRAKSQYKPPDEKMVQETSYSAQFTAESAKLGPADNKLLERRRIRSLYSEPYKESPKVEKPSPQPPKPKKTPTSHKPLKKAKDKQMASSRAAKKKSTEAAGAANPEDKEKSKEMNNKLAEAKE